MCRIAGYIGEPVSDRRVPLLVRGLIMAEESGNPHGTGLLIKKTDKKYSLIKKGIRGRDFLVQGFSDFLWKEGFTQLFVHLRYKTRGEQSDRNAHPFGFRVNRVWHFAMHNGVISDGVCEALARKFGCSQANVDSETFFWGIQEQQNRGEGLIEAIKEATYFVSDSAEFAFAYMAPDAVYLWRSEGRPLVVFDLREVGLGRWFASTKEMFEKAVSIAGLKSEMPERINYFELRPFRLYKVGHETQPQFEVEMVCDLPKKEKPKPQPVSVPGYKYTLFDVDGEPITFPQSMVNSKADFSSYFGDEEDDNLVMKDPTEMSDTELEKEIKEIRNLIWEGEDYDWYFSELLWERERRKAEKEAMRKTERTKKGEKK